MRARIRGGEAEIECGVSIGFSLKLGMAGWGYAGSIYTLKQLERPWDTSIDIQIHE